MTISPCSPFFAGSACPESLILNRNLLLPRQMTTPQLTSFFDSGNERLDPIIPIRVRIITLGDVGTGKSCLIKRYCEPSRFASKSVPTIGVDYGTRACRVRNGGRQLEVKMDFFDLSGEWVKVRGCCSHPLFPPDFPLSRSTVRRSRILRGTERILQERRWGPIDVRRHVQAKLRIFEELAGRGLRLRPLVDDHGDRRRWQ